MTCGGGALVCIIYWLHSGTGSNIQPQHHVHTAEEGGDMYWWLRAFFLFEPEVSL